MGHGGDRFSNYIKISAPITLAVFVVTLLVLPVFRNYLTVDKG